MAGLQRDGKGLDDARSGEVGGTGEGKGKKEQDGAGKMSHKQKERREEANKPHSVFDGQTDRASLEAQVMLGLPQNAEAEHHTASPDVPGTPHL